MDVKEFGPWAVIAGGSEGTGASFSNMLAAQGINLVLLARKKQVLEELAEAIRKKHGVQVRALQQDLTDPELVQKVRAATDDIDVGLVIFNAGVAHSFGHFIDAPIEEARKVVSLNVTCQMELSYHFGRKMRERGGGAMIMMGSVAGVAGGAKTAVYSGAKAFSHALAEALWYEMKPHNIHVLGVILGLTRTATMIRQVGSTDKYEHALAEPDFVAKEALENIKNGPIWVVSRIAERVHALRTLPRPQAVEAISKATASFEPHADPQNPPPSLS